MKIGLVTGCFDVIHAGHINLLKFAKQKCDWLIVGLENDTTIKISKGSGRPIHNLKQRLIVLSELKSVDRVFPIRFSVKFGQKDAYVPYQKWLKKISPHVLITHQADRYLAKKTDMMRKIGGQVVIFHGRLDTSTTRVAKLIAKDL